MLRREFILNYFGSFATGNYVSIGFYSLISLLELIKKYVVLKKKKHIVGTSLQVRIQILWKPTQVLPLVNEKHRSLPFFNGFKLGFTLPFFVFLITTCKL